jgi:Family of unknown function (DUF6156)
MHNFQMVLGVLSLSIVSLMVQSCHAQGEYHPGGPYYYESFSGYNIPFRPIGEITIEKAKNLDSYYIAYFNDKGKIISFEKNLYCKREFIDHYYYRADGTLERREGTKATGEITIQYFDKTGKLIKK